MFYIVFFFNDTATTEIYTLPLHASLPIFRQPLPAPELPRLKDLPRRLRRHAEPATRRRARSPWPRRRDGPPPHLRSEEHRLNSSHANISYAVFCLKKKKLENNIIT